LTVNSLAAAAHTLSTRLASRRQAPQESKEFLDEQALPHLKSDGPKPIEPVGCGPAIWGNKGFTPDLVDGLLQESARDPGHANFALAGMVDVAETARQQGIDLYSEIGPRVMAALEFQAGPRQNSDLPTNQTDKSVAGFA
jgi:hypothetical protein